MVVTVIIGIIVGAVVPAFTRLMNGSAVSHGLRITTSQLNMARTEACVRRKYVAVVFLDKDCDDAGAYLSGAAKALVGYRCAFRSCFVTKNESNEYEFEKWIPGTKWEFLPKGSYFSTLDNLINVTKVKDNADSGKGVFKDDGEYTVHAVVFSPSGRSAEKKLFKIEVREGVVTDNKTVTRNNNADNKLTARVNCYTGSIRTTE